MLFSVFQAIAKRREELLTSLPVEPDRSDPNAIRIVIRLPHGERMDRFFLKSDRLQVGFYISSKPTELRT